MPGPSRYDVSKKDAGIGKDNILENKLGIKDQKGLEDAETILLKDSYAHFYGLLSQGRIKFDFPLLLSMHKYFFDPLYVWAGKLRTVDISKDGMLFAPVAHLAASVKDLNKLVRKNLPTKKDTKKHIAEKIAVIHDECNAVHPFREGNGRTIRLFLDLMVTDLGLPPVDWSVKGYMRACRKGMSQDHAAMVDLVYQSITKKVN